MAKENERTILRWGRLAVIITIFAARGCGSADKQRTEKQKPEAAEQMIAVENETKTSEQEITEVANQFLKSKGVILEDKYAYYDIGNKDWERTFVYIKKENSIQSLDYAQRLDVLRDRDYQAISYCPKNKLTLGGIYWVFVDKKSKEIIYWFGMK